MRHWLTFLAELNSHFWFMIDQNEDHLWWREAMTNSVGIVAWLTYWCRFSLGWLKNSLVLVNPRTRVTDQNRMRHCKTVEVPGLAFADHGRSLLMHFTWSQTSKFPNSQSEWLKCPLRFPSLEVGAASPALSSQCKMAEVTIKSNALKKESCWNNLII